MIESGETTTNLCRLGKPKILVFPTLGLIRFSPTRPYFRLPLRIQYVCYLTKGVDTWITTRIKLGLPYQTVRRLKLMMIYSCSRKIKPIVYFLKLVKTSASNKFLVESKLSSTRNVVGRWSLLTYPCIQHHKNLSLYRIIEVEIYNIIKF